MRIVTDVDRGRAVTFMLNGAPVAAFDGEPLAAAMLAHGRRAFRRDTRGQARGLFCNMGTCSECFVMLCLADGARRRARACLVPVRDGLVVETAA